MIAHLSGILLQKSPNQIVIDTHGVGYALYIPLSTFYQLGDEGGQVSLRVHTHVREDSIALFGFMSQKEKELFEKLISISGIGPKVAESVTLYFQQEAGRRLIAKLREAGVRLEATPEPDAAPRSSALEAAATASTELEGSSSARLPPSALAAARATAGRPAPASTASASASSAPGSAGSARCARAVSSATARGAGRARTRRARTRRPRRRCRGRCRPASPG